MFKVIALFLALMGALTACENQTIPEHVIVIPEDYDGQFNADSGDTLILVMYQEGDWQERCYHSGGEPILNVRTNIATCEGVDF